MKLRNYKDRDFPHMEKLLKETGLYCPLDTRENLKRQTEHDPGSIIVAEDGGSIMGTVFILYNPWNSFVYHLGVHPDYRKRGMATELMKKAELRLKSRGIKRPTVFIEEENSDAVKFYEKRGWFVRFKTFCMKKDLGE